MGYEVYDCDRRAKIIVDRSQHILTQLAQTFGAEILSAEGHLDRQRLAAIVFADTRQLARLNAIVHGAVIDDLQRTISRHAAQFRTDGTCQASDIIFFETAILYESGLNSICDEIWWVDAPRETRIQRIIKRNNISRAQALSRMDSQEDHPRSKTGVHVITNDNIHAVMPQLIRLLDTSALKS